MDVDFKAELKSLISSRIEEMPPSERPEFESFLGVLNASKVADERVYFLVVRMNNREDARKIEHLASMEGCKGAAQQAVHWTQDGDLMVYMALRMTTALYTQLVEHERKETLSRWGRLWEAIRGLFAR
jgi:hypothetical protein